MGRLAESFLEQAFETSSCSIRLKYLVRALVFATDVSGNHGIGAYVEQTLSGIHRVRPDWQCTIIAMGIDSAADIPEGYVVRRHASKLGMCVWGVIEALKMRPDEIFAFHVGLMPLAWFCAILGRVRLTLFTYGWEVATNRSLLDRYVCSRASRVAAISRWTALEFERFLSPIRYRRTSVIDLLPPTFDQGKYTSDHTARTAFRERLKIDLDDTVLLTVGRLDPTERYKGHEKIIRLLPRLTKQHPRIKYVVVGQGNDRERLQNVAIEMGVDRIVRFLGFASDLQPCYAAADLFVMPSTHEGFGIVFLEALASGLIVVAGGVDGSPTPLSWGLNGFLCDPYLDESIEEAILSALASLTDSDARVRAAGRAARVRRDFGPPAFDRRLDKFLSNAG
jgi:phosphatidylinositol alpha-1,6-mannosyltransferase